MDRIEEMRKRLIDSAKKKVQQKYEQADVHIIKSVNVLEDIDPIANLLIEQLREWHSVHFPELSDIVSENSDYAKLVGAIGKREEFTSKKINAEINSTEIAQQVEEAAKKSIGSNVSEEDLAEMKTLALNCVNLLQQREYLSKYLEGKMKSELPHFSEIAGPVIGAKMLSKVGSKKKLAFLPASTLQLIGAEKALFMHFKKGVKGPKYGFLFQHPLIKAAKFEDKGRLARTIASKLSIAAKMDYFGSKESAEPLKQQIEKRAAALHGAQKKPTKPVVTPQQAQRSERREFNSFGETSERKSFSSTAPRREFRGEGRRNDFKSAPFRRDRDYSSPRRSFDRPSFRSEGSDSTPRRKPFEAFRSRDDSRPARTFEKPFRREGESSTRPFQRRERPAFTKEPGPNRSSFGNRSARPSRHGRSFKADERREFSSTTEGSERKGGFGRGNSGRGRKFGSKPKWKGGSNERKKFR